MFRIKISEELSGIIDEGKPQKYIEVKEHGYLAEHLKSKGIELEELNFFTWAAFPERSYGKFLVSEAEWISVFGVPQTKPGEEPKARLATLTIMDELNQLTFFNLEIVSTSFVMSPVYPVGEDFQDGTRLLIVELEHNGLFQEFRQTNRIYKEFDYFSDILFLFENPDSLNDPVIYNRHRIANVTKVDYIAFIASSNFLTAYLPPNALTKAKLTDKKFIFPTNAQLLYDKVSTLDRPLSYTVILKSDSLCKEQYVSSDPKDIAISDNVYRSPVNANTETDNISIVMPYELYDHIKDQYIGNYAKDLANATAEILKPNANTRLARNVDLIYQGLILGELTNDVQRITYYYQGYKYGLRTRLQTIPWKIHECILSIRDKCKDTMFRGILLSDYTAGVGASAVVLDMSSNLKVIEYTQVVKDPIGVFSTLKKGASVLLYKSCGPVGICDYYIVQSECPTTIPPSNITGKCVITGYCYNTIEDVCDKLNGTWTAGATCSSTPFGN